nr:unnamed protein product [Callosobruchus chinensis]
MKLILCAFLLGTIGTEASNATQSPICEHCSCNYEQDLFNVYCSSQSEQYLFAATNWNGTYDYNSLTFQNGVLPNLTQIFPSSNLTSLDLSYNDINSIGAKVFMNLKNMRTLILSHNDLENIDPDTFKVIDEAGKPGVLSNLKELRLDYNKIHILNPNITEHVIDIEILDLSNNPLDLSNKATLLAISTLSNLKLYLGNNKLSYLESDLLARWDNLLHLDINDNPWTCECENQWLIEELMPIYIKINPENAKKIKCAAPIEMKNKRFLELFTKKSHMRCLDANDARPEMDAAMLVGVLAGVLLAIPTILFLIFAYQRRWISLCGICDDSPAAYSRRFYSTSAVDDNF